jgi:hypothetical protein
MCLLCISSLLSWHASDLTGSRFLGPARGTRLLGGGARWRGMMYGQYNPDGDVSEDELELSLWC